MARCSFLSKHCLETSFWQVEIKDIVWPGEALKPPEGVPEKRFLSITFLEEDPYIMLNSPTTCTGATKGTICNIRVPISYKGLSFFLAYYSNRWSVDRCNDSICKICCWLENGRDCLW